VGRVLPGQLQGCPARGCFTVTSVMFELASDDEAGGGANPFLAQLLARTPLEEGVGGRGRLRLRGC
jgi:hypothetical protein